MRSALRLLLIPVACALSTAAVAEDPKVPGLPEKTGKKIDNPNYASWSKFKVGAWVRHASSSVVGENGNAQKMTQKLVELTDEKLVIEMTMSMQIDGKSMDMPANRMEHLKQMDEYKPADVPEEEKPVVKEGEETLLVGDKKIACKTTETTSKVGGSPFWSKIWMSAEVPGGLVKMEHKSETAGMKVTTSSVLEAWGDK